MFIIYETFTTLAQIKFVHGSKQRLPRFFPTPEFWRLLTIVPRRIRGRYIFYHHSVFVPRREIFSNWNEISVHRNGNRYWTKTIRKFTKLKWLKHWSAWIVSSQKLKSTAANWINQVSSISTGFCQRFPTALHNNSSLIHFSLSIIIHIEFEHSPMWAQTTNKISILHPLKFL